MTTDTHHTANQCNHKYTTIEILSEFDYDGRTIYAVQTCDSCEFYRYGHANIEADSANSSIGIGTTSWDYWLPHQP